MARRPELGLFRERPSLASRDVGAEQRAWRALPSLLRQSTPARSVAMRRVSCRRSGPASRSSWSANYPSSAAASTEADHLRPSKPR